MGLADVRRRRAPGRVRTGHDIAAIVERIDGQLRRESNLRKHDGPFHMRGTKHYSIKIGDLLARAAKESA
eukprot:6176657-Pleurochrysis_carterae.AAC.1